MAREIEILLYRTGQSTPFSEWLASLRDARVVGIVRARLNRIRLGNLGDCKSVGGRRRGVADRFRSWVPDLLRPAGIVRCCLALR
jgi:putative component of toxin-antitoxin plasmid stabilization module